MTMRNACVDDIICFSMLAFELLHYYWRAFTHSGSLVCNCRTLPIPHRMPQTVNHSCSCVTRPRRLVGIWRGLDSVGTWAGSGYNSWLHFTASESVRFTAQLAMKTRALIIMRILLRPVVCAASVIWTPAHFTGLGRVGLNQLGASV